MLSDAKSKRPPTDGDSRREVSRLMVDGGWRLMTISAHFGMDSNVDVDNPAQSVYNS